MDASVNFGAAKLTVYGDTTIDEIEKAGAFENIKVFPGKQKIVEQKVPFLQKHSTVFVSIVFLLIGWMAAQLNGEESLSSILAYGAAILIGGYRLFTTGLKNLIRFEFDMKTLMMIAVIGAAFIGEWGEGATVVILFAISEALRIVFHG